MTTAETAADVQVPEIGEHSSPLVDGVNGEQPQAEQAEPVKPTTFTFQPSEPEFGPPEGFPPIRQAIDYGGPIVVPNRSVIVAPGTERWFFRQFRKVQERVEASKGSPLELAFFWLEKAGANEDLISRVALLSLPEWERFYSAWMSGAADSNLGE